MPATTPRPTSEWVSPKITSRPRPPPPIKPRDDDYGEHHHDGLVDPEQDRGARERQLHLPEHLSRRRAVRQRRLGRVLRHPADPEVGQPDARRERVDERGDDPRARARRGTARSPARGRRTPASSASRRAAGLQRPSGTRRCAPRGCRSGSRPATASTTATATWLSVSIAMSHMPEHPDRRQAGERQDRQARSPRGRHPMSAAPPATIHHGRPCSRSFSGSRPHRMIPLLIGSVRNRRLSSNHPTTESVGPAIENVHSCGKSCWRRTSRPITTPTAVATIARTMSRRPREPHTGDPRRLPGPRSRWLHPYDTRSRTIARTTIAMPALSASPTS